MHARLPSSSDRSVRRAAADLEFPAHLRSGSPKTLPTQDARLRANLGLTSSPRLVAEAQRRSTLFETVTEPAQRKPNRTEIPGHVKPGKTSLATDRTTAPTATSGLAGKRSEPVLQHRLTDAIHNSPRMAVQRHRMGGLITGAGQLGGVPSGGAAQMKPGPCSEPAVQFEPESRSTRNDTGLPGNLKYRIESHSGLSLDNVKVHYDSAHSAQLNAKAYAQGNDIHVAPGQERHLPHEAWHVVQQAHGPVKQARQLKDGVQIKDDAELEREADVMEGGTAGLGLFPRSRVSSEATAGDARERHAMADRAVGEAGVEAGGPAGSSLSAVPGPAGARDEAGDAAHFTDARSAPVQRKAVRFDNSAQVKNERSVHYGKEIHFIDRHGPDITDARQRERLIAQVEVFEFIRRRVIAEYEAAIKTYTADIGKLADQIAAAQLAVSTMRQDNQDSFLEETAFLLDMPLAGRGDPSTGKRTTRNLKNIAKKENEEIPKWIGQVETKRGRREELVARARGLAAIAAGSLEMIQEMTDKPELYKQELQKSAFQAGTPTQMVTRFDNQVEMLGVAEAIVKAKAADWAASVGEAGAEQSKREGKFTAALACNLSYTVHALRAGPEVAKTERRETVDCEVTFVAEDKKDNITARAEPILLLAETGYAKPPV